LGGVATGAGSLGVASGVVSGAGSLTTACLWIVVAFFTAALVVDSTGAGFGATVVVGDGAKVVAVGEGMTVAVSAAGCTNCT
jgi:hypothetical protein